MNAPTRLKKIVIFTGYKCNNKCVFCIDSRKRDFPEKTTSEIVRELYKAKKEKANIVEIIGGESTIRRDFACVVRTAKKLGINEVLTSTNGRIFSDIRFARQIVEAGIDGIIFSIHGHNCEVHDRLTRVPGSFSELVKGIENLRKLGFKNINGNTTVVKSNMRYLPEIGRLYIKYGIKNVEFIFVDPTYGGAHDCFENLVPKISECAPYMRKVLNVGDRNGFPRWKVRYVPLCYFHRHLSHISDINERVLFFTQHWAPDFKNTDAVISRQMVSRRKTPRCFGCRLFNICEGIWTEYLKHYGDGELKAIK